jgi:hypothetical protein
MLRIHLARVLLGALIAATALTFSPRSFAQNGDVNTLIESGFERYKRRDYEGARTVFARAHEVDPSEVGILFNLALAELHSGHPVDAANHLRAFIASTQAQPDRRESARTKWLPEAESQIGRVSVDAPAGTQVSMDGTAIGVAPFDQLIYVAPGDHDLAAKFGSGEHSMRVTAVAGNIVTARFVPEPAPPALPASGLPPPPPPPEKPVVAEAPPSRRTSPSTAKIVTVAAIGGTAIVATGIAIGFAQASLGAENHAKSLRSQPELSSTSSCYPPGSPSLPAGCADLSAAVSDQSRYYWLQVGFYVGAGALAATAVTTWLLWPNATRESSWSIQPAVGARSAGAQFVGSF